MKSKITLPEGAREIRPIRRKIGTWVELDFDAKLRFRGVWWFRVMGGFGGNGDREDWVADIDYGCVSVSDYHWRGKKWGSERYQTFQDALIGRMKGALGSAQRTVSKLRGELLDAKTAVKRIEASINWRGK